MTKKVGRRMPQKVRDIKKMPPLKDRRRRDIRFDDAYPQATYNRISRKGSITKKPRWA